MIMRTFMTMVSSIISVLVYASIDNENASFGIVGDAVICVFAAILVVSMLNRMISRITLRFHR